MSNSPLVSYVKISPHKVSPRNHKIDTITIHCVVGQCNVEPLGELFQTKEASSNYGIGKDGRIAMYVEEKDRSFCSSNSANDNRAITIECASDMSEPFAVNDTVYNSLINLLVDICKRNDIKELRWKADKNLIGQVDKQNMTVHRWFHSGKSCPGTFLYERMGKIADDVNIKLGVATKNNSVDDEKVYRVQIGAFSNKENATAYLKKAQALNFTGFIVRGKDNIYRVQIGAFTDESNAKSYLKKAKDEGFDGFVVPSTRNTSQNNKVVEVNKTTISLGKKVKINKGAKDYNGNKLATFVYNNTYTVSEIKNDRVVVTYNKIIVAAVNINDLTLV